MGKRGPAPVVRHSYAADPNPEKVEAALEVWRRALAQRMAGGVPVQTKAPDSPEF